MERVMKIRHMPGAVTIACLLVALAGSRGAAQEDKPIREVYQAQAMGQGTQLGQNFNVTINFERYATPEERQVLLMLSSKPVRKAYSIRSKKCTLREESRLPARWATTSASFGRFRPTTATRSAS